MEVIRFRDDDGADGLWIRPGDPRHISDPDMCCRGCGVDVFAIDEFFELHDHVCELPDGVLCVGCMERHLGRRLVAADFTNVDLRPAMYSARLRDRLGIERAR